MASVGDGDEQPGDDDLVGRVVDKYKLVRLIGVGGMGRVYEGAHTTIGKRVALKFIDPESTTAEAVQRFQREAQAASSVESAHIVEIIDVGTTDDGLHFIVMELLRGEDLGHRIRSQGRLEPAEALRVGAHVLRGLARAHDAGIVHRDLKPDNVFLVERDDDPCFAKILDFGVSKIQRRGDTSMKTITREGVVLGTPVYMSPEQAQALPDVDLKSDLWSVGAILFESMTGRAPHSGTSYEQVIVHICTKDVDDVRLHNPLVPAGVAEVLKKALTRDRDQRFQSAREMLDALVEASEGSLSPSLASDSLRRAIIRPPSNGSGDRTFAAVSTVAATPGPPGVSTSSAPSGPHRIYLLIGAIGIGIGGVGIGMTWGRGHGAPTTSPSTTSSAGVTGGRIIAQAHADASPSHSAMSSASPEPSASQQPSASARTSTSATPSASADAAAPVIVSAGTTPMPPTTGAPTSTVSLQKPTPHDSAKPLTTAAPTSTVGELQLKEH